MELYFISRYWLILECSLRPSGFVQRHEGEGHCWQMVVLVDPHLLFLLFLLKATSHLVPADLSHFLSGHASLVSWCPTQWLNLALYKAWFALQGDFVKVGVPWTSYNKIKSLEWSPGSDKMVPLRVNAVWETLLHTHSTFCYTSLIH